MVVQELYYERTFNLGDYNQEKIGCKIAFQPEDEVNIAEKLMWLKKEVVTCSTPYRLQQEQRNRKKGE